MKPHLFRFSALLALLCALSVFSFADPVTLLPGQRVTFIGGARFGGDPGSPIGATGLASFTLSADGATLVVNVENRCFLDSCMPLRAMSFSAASSGNGNLFSTPTDLTATVRSPISSMIPFSAPWALTSPSSNVYELRVSSASSFGFGGLLPTNNGTVSLSILNGPVQSLTLDNVSLTAFLPDGTTRTFPIPLISVEPAAVPEPATLALLGTGLGAVALRIRKRRTSSQTQ